MRTVKEITATGGQKGRRNELGLSRNVTDTRKTKEDNQNLTKQTESK